MLQDQLRVDMRRRISCSCCSCCCRCGGGLERLQQQAHSMLAVMWIQYGQGDT